MKVMNSEIRSTFTYFLVTKLTHFEDILLENEPEVLVTDYDTILLGPVRTPLKLPESPRLLSRSTKAPTILRTKSSLRNASV